MFPEVRAENIGVSRRHQRFLVRINSRSLASSVELRSEVVKIKRNSTGFDCRGVMEGFSAEVLYAGR